MLRTIQRNTIEEAIIRHEDRMFTLATQGAKRADLFGIEKQIDKLREKARLLYGDPEADTRRLSTDAEIEAFARKSFKRFDYEEVKVD